MADLPKQPAAIDRALHSLKRFQDRMARFGSSTDDFNPLCHAQFMAKKNGPSNAKKMKLIEQFGERWARNSKNIQDEAIPGKSTGGQGVYVLYDGSRPVYIGKGNIRQRLRDATKDERRKDS